MRRDPRFIPLLLALLLALAALPAAAAEPVGAGDSGFSGRVDLLYGQLTADEDGERVADAAYFGQQYSLLYRQAGKFAGGRGGGYSLALGAELTLLDNELNGESRNFDSAKILYQGALLLAPGGLPFRLFLYSDDMRPSTFRGDTRLANGILEESSTLPANLSNGQHIRQGGTLVVGIRNGSYQGLYRDVLSQFPRLLLDYQEDHVRDLESLTPQNYRDRNLAFVSLNKKDNWFHYRLHEFTDFIDPRNDSLSKTYMLGTVDHQLQRQWINLTNWIKVSADASLVDSTATNASTVPSETYLLNLFGQAARSNWRGATFTNFERSREIGRVLRKDLEVPVILSGELDRNTAWRFQFEGERESDDFVPGSLAPDRDKQTLFVNARVDALRQARYSVSPRLQAEVKSGDWGEGYGVLGGLEFFSNRKFDPRYEIFAAYSLARFAGTSQLGKDVGYWEQVAEGRVATRLSARVRTGIEERLVLGSGSISRTVVDKMIPAGTASLGGVDIEGEGRSADLLRSVSSLFVEYLTASRWRHRFELGYDYLSSDQLQADQAALRHILDYYGGKMIFTMRNEVLLGVNSASRAAEEGASGVQVSAPVEGTLYSHLSRLRYSPGRSWEAIAEVNYDHNSLDDGRTFTTLRARQEYAYSFYTVNGIVRKLGELRENLDYERTESYVLGKRAEGTFSLMASYFPTRVAQLGAKLRYRFFSEPRNYDDLALYLLAGLNFQKFSVSLNYGYGYRTEGDFLPQRQEQRWDVKVSKFF